MTNLLTSPRCHGIIRGLSQQRQSLPQYWAVLLSLVRARRKRVFWATVKWPPLTESALSKEHEPGVSRSGFFACLPWFPGGPMGLCGQTTLPRLRSREFLISCKNWSENCLTNRQGYAILPMLKETHSNARNTSITGMRAWDRGQRGGSNEFGAVQETGRTRA